MKQLRRCFGTIHGGNLILEEHTKGIRRYFEELQSRLSADGRFTAGAFALEETQSGNLHVQFYAEHSRMRPATLAAAFSVANEAVFDVVRDAGGSWAYCTGTGTHEGKPALERFEFGTPKLHGDTQRADLKMLVGLVMDGAHPMSILREYPYAYTVHRRRLWDLWRDLSYIEKYGTLSDPIER